MLDPVVKKYFKMCVTDLGKDELDRVSAKCPICGDSKTKSKKRLHLYQRDDHPMCTCFNGGCFGTLSFYNFLKIYYPSYYEMFRREKFILNVKPKQNDEINLINEDLSFLFKETTNTKITEELITNSSENISSLNEINELDSFEYLDINPFKSLSDEALNYVNSRIDYNKVKQVFGDFLQGSQDFIFRNRKYPIKDYLIIPFKRNNKLYGFYSRSIKEKKFYTLNLNDNYKIWNYFNLKPGKIFVFEGIFDALSFFQLTGETNIVALCGSTFSKEIFNNYNVHLCLDNDSTGIKKMLDYKEYKKLIYPKDFKYKDLNSMLQANESIDFKFESGLKSIIELKKLL